jgi:hypothetical protein
MQNRRSIVLVTLLMMFFASARPAHSQDSPRGVCVDPRGCEPGLPLFSDGARLDDLNKRFELIFDRLRPFVSAGAGESFDGAPSRNVAALERRIDRYFVWAAIHQQGLADSFEQNKSRLASYPGLIRSWELTRSQLRSKEGSTRSGALIAQGNSILAEHEATDEEALAAKLWKKGEQSSGRLLDMQVTVRNALLAVMPSPEDRDNFGKAFGDNFRNDHVFAAPAKRPEAIRAVQAQPQIVAARGTWLPASVPPSPPAGTIEVKLDALNGLASSIVVLAPAVAAQRVRLSPLETRIVEFREGNYALRSSIEGLEKSTARWNASAANAHERADFARENQAQYATDALTFAATASVWNHVRTTVVMPELERFLRSTGLLKGMPIRDALDRISANPAELIPTAGRLKEWQRVIDVQRKVLGLGDHWLAAVTASIKANADPTAGQYSTFLEGEIYDGLNQRGVHIVNTAAGSMKSPVGRVVRKWVQTAPVR